MYSTKTVSSQTTSSWIPLDDNQAAFSATVAVEVSGTLTYTVEFTLSNIQDPSVTPLVFPTALAARTTGASLRLDYPVTAVRLSVTSYTSGTATLGVKQGTSHGDTGAISDLDEHAAEHAAMSGIMRIVPWAGFVPRILPSYVASTTVDQAGTTVTVTATAHGIPNIALLTGGHEVYFPGSPSIAAGWYPDFVRASANTLTFTYPVSQTVTGESVNGGAAYTTATKFYELLIPGGSLGVNGECTGRLLRHCGSTAATKLTEYKLAGATIMKSPLATTLGCGFLNNTFANVGSVSKQLGFSVHDQIGVANGGQMYGAVNMTNDQILELYGTISAAADYLGVASAYVMVKP